MLESILWPLLTLVLISQAFIGLEVVCGRINIPIVDLAALILVGLFGVVSLRRVGPSRLFQRIRLEPLPTGPMPPLPLVAPVAYGFFLAVGVLSWGLTTDWFFPSGYFLLRKALFCYLVYGVGLAGLVYHLGAMRPIYMLLLAFAASLSLLILGAVAFLRVKGYPSDVMLIPGVTQNHKTLAVALAPYLPLFWMGRLHWSGRLRWASTILGGISLFAVLVSLSKTAWITAAFGLGGLMTCAHLGPGRLFQKPRWIMVGLLAAIGLMGLLPFLLDSPIMRNAFASRMSLNHRAWRMFSDHWLIGQGPGINVFYLMKTWPDSRVNGVDAHGVLQKVGSEFGLLGLSAYLFYTVSILRGFWHTAFADQARADALTTGFMAMGLALHVNLLLSTEAFTASHWVPLGLVLGVLLRAGRSRRPLC